MRVTLTKIGRLVVASGDSSPSASFQTGELYASEVIPAAYRPAASGNVVFVSNNGGALCSWNVNAAGTIILRGKADKGYHQTASGCWVTA